MQCPYHRLIKISTSIYWFLYSKCSNAVDNLIAFYENHTLNFPELGTYLTFKKKTCCQRATTFCFVYHTTLTEKMTPTVLYEGINEEVELQTFADQKRSSSIIFSSRVTKGSF